MFLNCGAGEDSWESLGLQGDQTSQSQRKLTLSIQWKDWCWSWSSNTLATWCKEMTHWKVDLLEKTLMLGKTEGRRRRDDRTWDGWMASSSQWTWFWVSSERWWRIRKTGVLQSMEVQRVGPNWATEKQQQRRVTEHYIQPQPDMYFLFKDKWRCSLR